MTPDLFITSFAIGAVAGTGMLGILALPWSDPELRASSLAWSTAVTQAFGAVYTLVGKGTVQLREFAAV